mgnify:CR=1 FL=1
MKCRSCDIEMIKGAFRCVQCGTIHFAPLARELVIAFVSAGLAIFVFKPGFLQLVFLWIAFAALISNIVPLVTRIDPRHAASLVGGLSWPPVLVYLGLVVFEAAPLRWACFIALALWFAFSPSVKAVLGPSVRKRVVAAGVTVAGVGTVCLFCLLVFRLGVVGATTSIWHFVRGCMQEPVVLVPICLVAGIPILVLTVRGGDIAGAFGRRMLLLVGLLVSLQVLFAIVGVWVVAAHELWMR